MRLIIGIVLLGLLVAGAAHGFDLWVDGQRIPLSGKRVEMRSTPGEGFTVTSTRDGVIVTLSAPTPISLPATPLPSPRARRWYGPGPIGPVR